MSKSEWLKITSFPNFVSSLKIVNYPKVYNLPNVLKISTYSSSESGGSTSRTMTENKTIKSESFFSDWTLLYFLLHFYSSIFLVFNVHVNIVFILLIKNEKRKKVHLCTVYVPPSRRQDHPPVAHSLLLFGLFFCIAWGHVIPIQRESKNERERNNPLSGNAHIHKHIDIFDIDIHFYIDFFLFKKKVKKKIF